MIEKDCCLSESVGEVEEEKNDNCEDLRYLWELSITTRYGLSERTENSVKLLKI
jgi:hypothetical protein